MERYSHTHEGAWYSFKWVDLPTGSDGLFTDSECECPMHEQPLKLLPIEMRQQIVDELNKVHEQLTPQSERADLYTLKCADELDPLCKRFMNELLKRYDGDLEKVLEKHIRLSLEGEDENLTQLLQHRVPGNDRYTLQKSATI